MGGSLVRAKEIKSEAEFDATIKESHNLYVAVFYVGQDKEMAALYEEFTQSFPAAHFLLCCKNDLMKLVKRYGITGDPEAIMFKDGKRIDVTGLGPKPAPLAIELNGLNVLKGLIKANQ